MKWKLRIYCNDGEGCQYLEDGIGEYETYDKALIACYGTALEEVSELMRDSDIFNWFEVEQNFEVTEAYKTEALKDVVFFPIATVYYDKAPWDRDNDCEIRVVTGYDIVEVNGD